MRLIVALFFGLVGVGALSLLNGEHFTNRITFLLMSSIGLIHSLAGLFDREKLVAYRAFWVAIIIPWIAAMALVAIELPEAYEREKQFNRQPFSQTSPCE